MHLSAFDSALWLLVAVAAGALLARWRGGRRWTALPGALLFLMVFAVLESVVNLHDLAGTAAELAGRQVGTYPHAFGAFGLELTLAVAALLAVLYWLVRGRHDRRWSRILPRLLVLELAVLWISFLYWGYGHEIEATGKLSLLAALMIILALTWDVVLSGESITNRHSIDFPRHTRVMLFMGYEMLVSTSVLFFSSLEVQSSGQSVGSLFEADKFPQRGLLQLAMPFVVALFFLQISSTLQHRRAEPHTVAST
jgi:drug/metabolite transporter (DMT)-like permease